MLVRFPKHFGTDAWQGIKDLKILMEVVIKNCSNCPMDLPVAWLQVTQVTPTSSPTIGREVSWNRVHVYPINRFTLWVVSNWPSQKQKHQFGVSSPLPGCQWQLKLLEIQDSLPNMKTCEGCHCYKKRGSTPNSIFYNALEVLHIKKAPFQSVPHLQKIWRRWSPAVDLEESQQCLPLGKSGCLFEKKELWEFLFKVQELIFGSDWWGILKPKVYIYIYIDYLETCCSSCEHI